MTVPTPRVDPGIVTGFINSVPEASLQTGSFAELFIDRALDAHVFAFPFLALFGFSPCYGHYLSILTLDI